MTPELARTDAGAPRSGLRPSDLLSGEWFPRVVAIYLERRVRSRGARAARRPKGDALVEQAAVDSAMAGAASAAMATGAAWLASEGPLGVLAALPLGVVAVAGDMLVRALLDVRLVCDLAEDAGAPFSAGDMSEVARLCALAPHGRAADEPGGLGRSLVERLTADDGEHARSSGSRRLGEGIAKNLLPIVNVATSAWTSWFRTRQLGRVASRYVRFRRVVEALRTEVTSPSARAVAIAGAWVLFVADGPLEPAESSLLAHALRGVSPDGRRDVAGCIGTPDAFARRLAALPRSERDAVVRALERLAAADGEVSAADRRVLDSASRAVAAGAARARAARHDGAARPGSRRGAAPEGVAHP